jgi:hypothetical protein
VPTCISGDFMINDWTSFFSFACLPPSASIV